MGVLWEGIERVGGHFIPDNMKEPPLEQAMDIVWNSIGIAIGVSLRKLLV
jgi:hypothetical protein